MSTFGHERLDVYQEAVDFLALADGIVELFREVEPRLLPQLDAPKARSLG